MRQRFIKWFSVLAVSFMMAVFAPVAQAVLLDVGPADLPSPAGNGFPFWYRDLNRVALAPCLSQALLPSGPACVLLADPGFNPALPIVFPTNYPIETFYVVSDALLTVGGVGGGQKIKYRAGLEGSFATGVVTPGGQVSFTRIRIFADLPVAGTYKFTHPYGVETITAATAGARAITFTRDIGVGAPFAGALTGDLGPWLLMTGYPKAVGAETFIGDPNVAGTVTGSPFGTNFFRVDGPVGSNLDGLGGNVLQTNLFTLAGKIAAAGLGSPLTIDKATYTRDAATTQVSVFATTQPISNATTGLPPNPLALLGTPSTLQFNNAGLSIPTTLMTTNNPKDGKFYGLASVLNPALTLPTTVTVTNTADVPQSSTTVPLVDEVAVIEASYANASKLLKVSATSGDKLVPPAMAVFMQDGAQDIPLGTLPNGGGLLSVTFPYTFTSVAGLKTYEIPPVRVIVRSATGGSDTKVVTGPMNIPPVAVNDAATVATGGSVIINVAANDTDPNLGDFVVPSSVVIVSSATTGTAFNNGNGTITYTAPAVGGIATFTYTIADSFGAVSNVATVTVTISSPPTASPVSATTNEDTAISITVSALPNTTVVVPPLHGTAVSLGNGSVVYTPVLNYNGADSFQYTVLNAAGVVSNVALVSITVTPVPDAPIAVNDTATTPANTPVTIAVLANDTHPDAPGSAINPATLTIVNPPLATAGTTSVVAGQVLFTPAANFFGGVTFTYLVSDNTATPLASLPATVTVTITPVNVAPVANNDAASTTVSLPRIITVLANDTDLNGNIAPGTVAIVSAASPSFTTAVNTLNGTVTFTSATAGTYTFTYTVADTAGAVSNIATVTVTVAAAAPTDSVTILRAQYTVATGQWVVEGSTTGVSPLSKIVTLYVGSTVPGPNIIGLIATTAADGRWKTTTTFVSPVPVSTISASLPSGASRLAFPVVVR